MKQSDVAWKYFGVYMHDIKQKLLDELNKDDWQQLQVMASPVRGRFDEHWKIQSTREQWATEVYVNFEVEPVWDAPVSDDSGVKSITATSSLPDVNGNESTHIATIDSSAMSVEQVISQLLPFVYSLNFYRRTQCVDV